MRAVLPTATLCLLLSPLWSDTAIPQSTAAAATAPPAARRPPRPAPPPPPPPPPGGGPPPRHLPQPAPLPQRPPTTMPPPSTPSAPRASRSTGRRNLWATKKRRSSRIAPPHPDPRHALDAARRAYRFGI